MVRIWKVSIGHLDSRNYSAPSLLAAAKKAERFLTSTRRDFDEPRAEITEIHLIAEA